MVRRKLPILTFALGVIIFISVVFWVIASGTSTETWKNIGYPSAFLLGFIGAASIIIPVPATVALLAVAGLRIFDPTLLALAFGFGAAAGELVGYGLGYMGRGVVGERWRRQLNAMVRIFERFGIIAIFIFALTPLPDDLLFIPLGLMHYSIWKAFAAGVAGKVTMSLIITHVGGAIGGAFTESWIFALVTTALLVLVVIAMFRIDWEKLADRYLPKKKKRKK